jgi:tRNA (guanine37-N1)-methyltransferase
MLHVDVISIFPQMFEAVTAFGITGRARDQGLWDLVAWNPRDFTSDPHRSVDDRPFGGGPGMVMLAAPLERAIQAARQRQRSCGAQGSRVIYLSPQGEVLDHHKVVALAAHPGLILVAGRYEGVDERVVERDVDDEISVGDYVVTGGELPAMILIDCVVRQLPGALGDADSVQEDSFVDGLLDCPHYTRPEVYDGDVVPPVLMSGHHAEIRRWRLKQGLGRTHLRRPDLLEKRGMSADEQALLEEFLKEFADRGAEHEHSQTA